MIPKFRAYSETNKDMVSWGNLLNLNVSNIFRNPEMCGMVLMQSAGLYDRNGVEVYEDDIVRCSRGCPHRVIWVKEYGGSFLGGMPAWYLSGLNEGYSWTGAEEIIGNIYENPELLKDVE